MFWYPQLKEIEKLKERLKEEYVYYEVTETYEKPKRTRKFYRNYIARKPKRYYRNYILRK